MRPPPRDGGIYLIRDERINRRWIIRGDLQGELPPELEQVHPGPGEPAATFQVLRISPAAMPMGVPADRTGSSAGGS